MEKSKQTNLKVTDKMTDVYDDGNIPQTDLPQKNNSKDIIPDEVPRRDGPGGENGK